MRVGKHKSSIRRIMGPSGSPIFKNFVEIIRICAEFEGIKITVCDSVSD